MNASNSKLFAVAALTAACFATPALAYRIDTKTQTVAVSSLADFDKCQNEIGNYGSSACIDALKVYVKAHPKDAFEAGKHVRLQLTSWAALDFFAQALAKKPSAERCADHDVLLAVVSGLELPPDYPALALAKKIMRDACWEQLKSAASKDLDTTGYLHDNLCPLLAEKGVSEPKCTAAPEKPAAPPPSALSLLKGVDWKKLGIDTESSTALRGANGEELMFVRTKPGAREFVLLKFKGVRGQWNKQVLLALEQNGGTGKDYVVAAEGGEWVALTVRDGQYQGFPKGVEEGIWLRPVRPNADDLKAPSHQEVANEFAVASKPGK